ncbi:MAG: acetyl-CoA carboxylase biotin carboxylase subunit [Hyphomicrobiales bacterium]|nr:acetyl-CoA carboxylase biotin carboxylase subunit [Hyphomicrobiales bacterium]
MQHILIANRGEIAVRAARTGRKLGLTSTSVYSQADSNSPHAWVADNAVCIGPPPSLKSYLNVPALLHVAERMGCDAVYPGYGFLAENADFAEQCQAKGLIFIGPQPETIRLMGDKAKARETATRLGVPVVPGSDKAFTDRAKAQKAAGAIGYPLLLKARSGGGGRGMRIAEDAASFAGLFEQARSEAEAAFGDGAIYLERFFAQVRHIEVQIFGDCDGNIMHFGERDCSIQRRHQKLVEEAPSPALDAKTREGLHETALVLAKGIDYRGAGTVEFIYAPNEDRFYFIEMNTRIQVEHPVSEEVCGLDLVELQMRIARGELLTGLALPEPPGGHAIEFRINAEDWRQNFTPAPGVLTRWRPPVGDGIRVDSHAYEAYAIPPYYDSMIGKLIVHGRDRADALARAGRALQEFDCAGVPTTLDFHKELFKDEDFRSGAVHTRWVENNFLPRMT